jgi:hypothetical protein
MSSDDNVKRDAEELRARLGAIDKPPIGPVAYHHPELNGSYSGEELRKLVRDFLANVEFNDGEDPPEVMLAIGYIEDGIFCVETWWVYLAEVYDDGRCDVRFYDQFSKGDGDGCVIYDEGDETTVTYDQIISVQT